MRCPTAGSRRGKIRSVAAALLLICAAGGCASHAPSADARRSTAVLIEDNAPELTQLEAPRWVPAVRATCRPPVDWTAEPLKVTGNSDHQIWISPSGATAYGVLTVRHLLMPFASDDKVLGEFLKGMKATEGRADLLSKRTDRHLGGLGGLRFDAEGGNYTVRGNLMTSGSLAWIVYAGTRTGLPVHEEELPLAELARERTRVQAAGGGPSLATRE